MTRVWFVHAALFLLLLPQIAPARTITLVADEWPPFNTSPEAEHKGYMVDIAREVFGRLGHRVDYRTVPWPRAIEGVRTGEYDGVIGVTRLEAQGLVLPAESLGNDQLAIYTRQGGAWRFDGMHSLESVRLGVVKGYGYVPSMAEYIARNIENADRIHMNSGVKPLERLLRMLVMGRIDAVLDTEVSIRYVAAELDLLDTVAPAGRLEGSERLFIAFSPAMPDSRELADALSEGVRRLRVSGEMAPILRHYLVEDWK